MIGSAIERGSLICAFDEHGMTLFSKAKGSGPEDGLLGFSGWRKSSIQPPGKPTVAFALQKGLVVDDVVNLCGCLRLTV